jgi:hypothetical protein
VVGTVYCDAHGDADAASDVGDRHEYAYGYGECEALWW